MMSEALARHLLECVKGGIDVDFMVGHLRFTIKHEVIGDMSQLYLYGSIGSVSTHINDIDIVPDGYLRIELDDEVLIGIPFEEVSE